MTKAILDINDKDLLQREEILRRPGLEFPPCN